MMMSKPAPSAQAPAEQSKPKAASVEDLERRLKMLGDASPPDPTPTAAAVAPPAAAAAAPSVEAPKPSKNALLARIMAAQERAKQAQGGAAPTAPPAATMEPPPPAFDAMQPPPFEAVAPAEPPPPQMVWDPYAAAPPAPPAAPPPVFAPPAPSAPAFDLLDHAPPPAVESVNAFAMPPPLDAPINSFVEAPPAPPSVEEESLDAVLGLEGLSPEEKKALLEEQAKIMASIEQKKAKAAPMSAADQFESRSLSAAVSAVGKSSAAAASNNRTVNLGDGQEVALHGQEKTRQAIADGTATTIQCLACQNWMQVTESATLMFCPVCQTVSPVGEANSETDAAMAQLQADLELAQALQKEEYQKAESSNVRSASKKAKAAKEAAAASSSSSWMEWLGFGTPAPAPTSSPERPMSFAQKPVSRGQVGVSRPPGAGGISQVPSYEESDSLVANDHMPAARVAERQPLFSCVADSITTAASSVATAFYTDEEGNVHGVDSSSLIMPSVGRQHANNGTYNPMAPPK